MRATAASLLWTWVAACAGYFAAAVWGGRRSGAAKFFIALLLVMVLHFRDGVAGGHTLRVELPGAFRTAPAQEGLCFNPCQLPTLGGRLSAAGARFARWPG